MSPELTSYLIWFLWLMSWAAAALWAARNVRRWTDGSLMASRFFTILGVALLFGIWSPRRMAMLQLWRLSDDWEWALDAVTVAGFAFAWWARLSLGKLWSAAVAEKENPEVVSSGPYSLVRHPIYTGLILSALATAVLKGSLVALVGAGAMALGWYLKARLEEELLHQSLGAAYDEYAAHTPMLVPFTKF